MTITRSDIHSRIHRRTRRTWRSLPLILVAILTLACAGGAPPVPIPSSPPPPPVEPAVAPPRMEDRESSAYALLARAPTLEACDRYLEEFAEGAHRAEVLALRAELQWAELRAAGDPDRLVEWLAEHPAGPRAEEARTLLEDLWWQRVRDTSSFALMDLYEESFPHGLHIDEVRRLRQGLEWLELVAAREVPRLRDWLRRNPESPHAPQATALWEEWRYAQVEADPTPDTCALYLTELPHGHRVNEVRTRCAELEWSRIEARRDRGELERWLAAHEDDLRRERAKRLLEELRFEELRSQPTSELCRRYLAEFPRGRFGREVRELLSQSLAWEAAGQRDSVESYLVLAADHPRHPRLDQARERSTAAYWRRRTHESPADGHAWTQLAEACLHERACTLAEVESHYRRALDLGPESAVALLGLARLYYNQDRYEAAQQLLDRSVALDDQIAATHLYLGRLQVRKENWRRAIEHLDRALELAPKSEEALFFRALSKLRVGGCRPALPDLQRLTVASSGSRSKFVLQAERHLETCTGGGR